MPGMDEMRVRLASDIIGRQVKHMTELVDDLLDVSRVARGLVELEMERVDIKTILDGAVEQSGPMIQARHHHFDVPMPAEPAWVLGHKTRVVQAIANLLNNAAKYTRKHGKIALALSVDAARLDISVIDNGNGISPALLPMCSTCLRKANAHPIGPTAGWGWG